MPSSRALPFQAGPFDCYHYVGGNLAEVYLARDTRTGFNRAVKVLALGRDTSSEYLHRFVAEGNAARRCTHPNIVTTYEAGEAGGLAFIAMEYLQGDTLRSLLEHGRLRTTQERVNVAWQVAHGLAYLHQQGIIHRDVKPENVNVDPAGHVKIFDFGVARVANQQLTREGQVVGTPLYLSPEQVRGDPVTPASDVYAFGVLLFVLFTGSYPYHAVNREDLYAAIVFYPPILTALEGKDVPRPVPQLIIQCLEKSPEARPRSFLEIEEKLRPLASPEVAGMGTLQVGVATQPSRFPAAGISSTSGGAALAPAPEVVPKPPRAKRQPLRRSTQGRIILFVIFTIISLVGGAAWYTYWPRPPLTRIPAKGGEMVLVAGGKGYVGRDHRAVDVPTFYIDRTEVSNATYSDFCRETGRPRPDDAQGSRAAFPVVNVTFDDAGAFCTWAGKRLPSDIEWEKAARGPEGRLYPWGDETRPELVNIPRGAEPHDLEPVESNLSGASAYGAINLLGNAWEWVAKQEPLEEDDIRQFVLNPPVTRSERAYQIRGGSYLQRIDLRQAVWDFAVAPARLRRADIGFRCVRP